MTDVLKSCPFCGGEAVIELQVGKFRVACRERSFCGACQLWADTVDEAIETWNRRIGDGR